MVNKKAQNMSLTTILLMVLGIVVVVLLIWGFSTGWSGFWDRISPFGRSGNVASVVQACALLCSSENARDFCGSSVKTVKLDDGKTLRGSCANFIDNPKVSVAPCAAINCGDDIYNQTCKDLGGDWKGKACPPNIDISEEVKDKSGQSTEKPFCCKPK